MNKFNNNKSISYRVGDRVFVFKEIEHPEGGDLRTVVFTDVDVKPCCYEDLASAKSHEALTIPLEMLNGRILETDVEGVDLSKYARIRMTLESQFTAQAIGLVRGGWLPSALAATRHNAVILLDRNIISEVAGRFKAGKTVGRKRKGADQSSPRGDRGEWADIPDIRRGNHSIRRGGGENQ